MVILKKISEEDLSFLLEIRNDDTTRVNLENDTVFNLDDCKQWFLNTKPEWFIILNENQEKVGYLRTNGDEVGCDIHPNHRRKGYAKQAFLNYLKDKTYATLWVFEDNFAINLYEKLGFIRNGESKTIRERKYIRMIYKFEKQKSCYIINFWLGERRRFPKVYEDDKLIFIKKQIEFLEKTQMNLSKIIFNFNVEKEQYDLLSLAINIIPKYIQNTEISINIRENFDFSYGAWNDIVKKEIDNFDYFIFGEDDYVFVLDNWDTYLIKKFNRHEDTGYLSMGVRNLIHNYDFTEFSNIKLIESFHSVGITSSNNLRKIIQDKGNLIIKKNLNKYESDNERDKIEITQNYWSVQYCIYNLRNYDVRDDYAVEFHLTDRQEDIWRLFWENEKVIIKSFNSILSQDYIWYMTYDLEYQKNYYL